MERDRVDVYTCNSEIGKEKNDPEGLGVKLPFNAEEVFECREGDDMFVVLDEEEAVGERISYIQITTLPEGISSNHPLSYELRMIDGNHFIRFPKEWPKSDNGNLGFNVEYKSDLVVEDAMDSVAVRVYRKEDYVFRNQKLVNNDRWPFFRFILALFGLEEGDTPDRSGIYQGQKVRIIPFDSDDEGFIKNIKSKLSDNIRPQKQEIVNAIQSYGLPATEAEKLSIDWYPSGEEWINPDETRELYSGGPHRELEIILPCKGSFDIVAKRDKSRSTSNDPTNAETSFREIGGNKKARLWYQSGTQEGFWDGWYWAENEDVIEVYVPS